MATNNFWLGKIDNLRDPVRNTRWRFLIPSDVLGNLPPSLRKLTGDPTFIGENVDDNMAVHIKTFTIPGIELKFEHHNYMGFKSAFPTNMDIAADITLNTILLEDMAAYEAIHSWQQTLINTGLLEGTPVGSSAPGSKNLEYELGLGTHKSGGAQSALLKNTTVKAELYDWATGNVILTVRLINAFPKSVGKMDFTYAPEAKLVTFDFMIHCDRWSIKVADPVKD